MHCVHFREYRSYLETLELSPPPFFSFQFSFQMIHKHLLVSLGPRGKVPILRLCLHSESSCNHNTKGDCCQLSVSPGLSGLLLLYSQGPSLQNVCLLRMWGKIHRNFSFIRCFVLALYLSILGCLSSGK